MVEVEADRRGAGDTARFAFAVLTVLATLILLCFGGLVTSKGAGMAVPDWPTSFGYNMFFFPWSMMVGGIFYEHSHRLLGALVGIMAVALMVWIWLAEGRRWLKGAAAIAVILVVIQGLMGGLRVIWANSGMGIIHAISGQSFFVLVSAIALWSSGYWKRVESSAGTISPVDLGRLSTIGIWLLVLILAQLAIAATMRHAHRGLSIPDFPLAYGQVLPLFDAGTLAGINAWRGDSLGLPPTTLPLIWLQMTHRLMAVATIGVTCILWAHARRMVGDARIHAWGLLILCAVAIQVILGVWTVWSNKAADIATAHVAVGALLFATVSLMLIVLWRLKGPLPFEKLA